MYLVDVVVKIISLGRFTFPSRSKGQLKPSVMVDILLENNPNLKLHIELQHVQIKVCLS